MALNQLGLGLLFSAKDAASGVMRKVRNGFAQTRDELGRFGNRADDAFKQMALGGVAFTAGLAGLGILTAAIPSAAVFGEKIAEISTLTDEASLNSGFLSDEVLRLNAAYGGSTAKQAKAMYDGISAGAGSAVEATALLEASNKLAVAGVTDVGTALDGLTSAMNSYGVSFDNASQYSDAFMTAVRQGKTTIPELSAVIGRVAPTASAMGVSFNEITAALATVTAKGLKTEEAATGLKAALANIIKPTADATAEAKRLGVDFTAAAVRSKGFAGVLKDVTSSSKFNEDSLAALFGSIEGLNVALALTSQGGQKFDAALKAAAGGSGAAEKAFQKMAATTAFQGKRFMGLAENTKILVGQALEPLAAAVLRVVNNILEGFGKIPKPILNFALRAFAAVSAVTALTGAVIMAKNAILIAGAAMKTFGISTSAGLLSAFLPALAVIGLAAAAIYAFKLAIDNNIGGLGDKFNEAKKWVTDFFTAASQLFSSGTLDAAMTKEFLGGQNSAVRFAIKIYQVAERVVGFLEGMVAGFEKGLTTIGPAFDRLGAAFGKLGDAIMQLIGPTKDAGAEFHAAKSAGERMGVALAKGVEIVTNTISMCVEVAGGFVSALDKVSVSSGVVSASLKSVKTSILEVGNAFGISTPNMEKAALLFSAIGAAVGGTIAASFNVVIALARSIGNVFADTAYMVSGAADMIVGAIRGLVTGNWQQLWQGMRNFAFGAMQSIIDIVGVMVSAIAAGIDALGSMVGKNVGAGKFVTEMLDTQRGNAKAMLGASRYGQETMVVPASSPAMTPPTAAVGTPTVSWAKGTDPATVAAAAKAAVGALPPVIVNTTMTLDGEQIGRLVTKAQANAASRGGTPAPVDVG